MLELWMTGNGMLIPKISDQKSLGTSQKKQPCYCLIPK